MGEAPWIVTDTGVAKRVPIGWDSLAFLRKTGLHGIGLIEVTDGVAEGDVAILPAGGALDGDRVRIKPPRGKPGTVPNLGR